MEPAVARALDQDQVIDITTIGRETGQTRRKEIWFHNLDGRLFITGLPGTRDWYANLLANPEFTFHLKQSAQADLPARAVPVLGIEDRRDIISQILAKLGWDKDLEEWVSGSPLVEIELLNTSPNCAS